MIIIGEKINSSIPSVKKMMDNSDFEGLKNIIVNQMEAGAEYIDVNTALCEDELDMMKRLCDYVIDNTPCGIMLDSPDCDICKAALDYIKSKDGTRSVIVNSVTVNERHQCLDEVKNHSAGIVVLLTDECGIPDNKDKRFENADTMIKLLRSKGFNDEDIYIDIIAESVAVNGEAANVAIDTLKEIRKAYPSVHILCGLSNISFGLPKRYAINNAFLTLCTYHGMDCVICDPLATDIKKAFMAAEVLNGSDDFCMEYIDEFRA